MAMNLVHIISLTLPDAFLFQSYNYHNVFKSYQPDTSELFTLTESASGTRQFCSNLHVLQQKSPHWGYYSQPQENTAIKKMAGGKKNWGCYLFYLEKYWLRKYKYHTFEFCPCSMKYEGFPLGKLHLQTKAIMLKKFFLCAPFIFWENLSSAVSFRKWQSAIGKILNSTNNYRACWIQFISLIFLI